MFNAPTTTAPATISEAISEAIYNTMDLDPRCCPCRGGGWHLSSWDSWHKCPTHFRGQRHPEMDYPETPYDVDPVDGRPVPPMHVRMAQDEGFDRYSAEWYRQVIRVWRRKGYPAAAHFMWTWGCNAEAIGDAFDRINDWSTD